jgi:hypothetical protein
MAWFSKLKCAKLYMGNSSGYATEITSTQLGYVAGVTAGAATASKAVVLDANLDFGVTAAGTNGIRHLALGQDTAGTRGQLTFWPDTTAKGKITMYASDNSGDDIITLTNGGNTGGDITVYLPNTGGYIPASTAQVTTAEIDILSGATATTTEVNYLDITTLGTGAASKAVVLDAGEDYTWPATGVLTYGVLNDATTNINATAAEINYACDRSARFSLVTDSTVNVEITDSDKTFVLNRAAGIAATLPAVSTAAGCRFTFVIGTALSGGNHTILTDSGEDKIHGGATGPEDAATSYAHTAGTAADVITLVEAKALVGDRVMIESDGVLWYFRADIYQQDGLTVAAS